jgi:hypothetical protein
MRDRSNLRKLGKTKELGRLGRAGALLRRIKPSERRNSVRGQYEFLLALQHYWPAFWKSLKAEVFECDYFHYKHPKRAPRRMIEVANITFYRWTESKGIADKWFQEVCWHTLSTWAILDRDALKRSLEILSDQWFMLAPNEPVMHNFQPVLDNPTPWPRKPLSNKERRILMKSPLAARVYLAQVERETPSQFERRMLQQFKLQLREYVGYYRNRLSDRTKLRQSAEWTALLMSGKTPEQIDRDWGLEGYEDGPQAIYRAAKRFAKKIGLSWSTVSHWSRTKK